MAHRWEAQQPSHLTHAPNHPERGCRPLPLGKTTQICTMYFIAVRFQLDQLNKEFNALNKEIANVRKVSSYGLMLCHKCADQSGRPRGVLCMHEHEVQFVAREGSCIEHMKQSRLRAVLHTQAGGDSTELQDKSKGMKEKIKEAEEKEKEVVKARDSVLVTIGNLVHESVPVSNDEVGGTRAEAMVAMRMMQGARLEHPGWRTGTAGVLRPACIGQPGSAVHAQRASHGVTAYTKIRQRIRSTVQLQLQHAWHGAPWHPHLAYMHGLAWPGLACAGQQHRGPYIR